MNHRLPFEILAAVLPLVLLATAAVYRRRARTGSQGPWDELVRQLAPVDRSAIARIAGVEGQHADSGEWASPVELDPSSVWELIGGMEGIAALESNCDVLIALACYVQQWYPEALVVAEEMRLNAREIKWHLERLRGAAAVGHLQTAFPDYAPRAVSTYFLMTQRLLALYDAAGLSGQSLRAAL